MAYCVRPEHAWMTFCAFCAILTAALPSTKGNRLPTREDILLLAQYNETVNRRLYDAAAALPPGEVRADRGAFFGSLLGTLNHLVVGDTIWLARFADHPSAFRALAPLRGVPPPASLTPPSARPCRNCASTASAWMA